jgi:hypothetical protein
MRGEEGDQGARLVGFRHAKRLKRIHCGVRGRLRLWRRDHAGRNDAPKFARRKTPQRPLMRPLGLL